MAQYPDVFIVGAARTPIGKFLGGLGSLKASDLGAIAIKEAVVRAGITGKDVDEVIMGHVVQAGQGQAPARQAAIKAGIDPFVLGTTTGHLMLVFRTGETDRQMAEAKLRLLDRLPVRVLGAVLNEIEAEGSYRYYSYLYGYTADEEPARIPAETGGSSSTPGA